MTRDVTVHGKHQSAETLFGNFLHIGERPDTLLGLSVRFSQCYVTALKLYVLFYQRLEDRISVHLRCGDILQDVLYLGHSFFELGLMFNKLRLTGIKSRLLFQKELHRFLDVHVRTPLSSPQDGLPIP